MRFHFLLRHAAFFLLFSLTAQAGFPQPLSNDFLRVQNAAQNLVAAGLQEALQAGAEEKPVDPNQPVPPNELTIRTGDVQIPVGPNTKITIEADRVTLVPAGTPLPPLPVEPPRALPPPPPVVPSAPVIPDQVGNPDPRFRENDKVEAVRGEPVEPRTVFSPPAPGGYSSSARSFKRLIWAAAAGFLVVASVAVWSIHQSGKSWRDIFSPAVTQIVPEQIESEIRLPEQLNFEPEESKAIFPQADAFSAEQKVVQTAAEQAGSLARPPKEELSPTEFEQKLYQAQITLLQGVVDAQKPDQPDGQGIFGRLRIASVPGEETGRNRTKAELAREQSAVDQAAAAVITVLQQEQFTKTASRSTRPEIGPATWKQYQQALGKWFDAQQLQLKRLVAALAGFVEKDRQLLPGQNILLRDYYLDFTAHRLAEISVEELNESRRLHGLMTQLGAAMAFSPFELPEGVGYGPSMVPAIAVPLDQLAPAADRPRILREAIQSMRVLLTARAKRVDARLAFLDWEIKAYREMIGKDPQSRSADYDRWNVELKITSRLGWVAQRNRILAQENYLSAIASLLEKPGKDNVDLLEAAQTRLREAEKKELYERVFFYIGGSRPATWRDAASGKQVSGSYAFTGGLAYLDQEIRRDRRNYAQILQGEPDASPQFELRLADYRRRRARLEFDQAVSDWSQAGLRRLLGIPTGAGSAGLNRSVPFVASPQAVVLFPELDEWGEVAAGLDFSDRMLTDAQRQALTVYGLSQEPAEPIRKKAAATAVALSQKEKAIAIRALWEERIWTAQEERIARKTAGSELETVSDLYLDSVYQEETNSVRIFEMRRLAAQLLMEGPLTLDQFLDLLKIPAASRKSPAYLNQWLVFSNDSDLLEFLGLTRWDLTARVGASDSTQYRHLREQHDEAVQLAIVARRYVTQNRIEAKRLQAKLFAQHKIGTEWDQQKIAAEIAVRRWMESSMTQLLDLNNRQMRQGMPLFPGNRPAAVAFPTMEDLAAMAYREIPQPQPYGGSVLLDGDRVPLTGGSYRASMIGVRSGLPGPLPAYQLRDTPLAGPRWVPPEQLEPVVVHDSNDPVTAAPSQTVFAVRQGPPAIPFLDNGPYSFVNPGLLPAGEAPVQIAGVIEQADPAAEKKVLLTLPVRQMRVVDGRPELRIAGVLSREVAYSRILDQSDLRSFFPSTLRGDLGAVGRVGDFLRAENGEPHRFLTGNRAYWLRVGVTAYFDNGKPVEEVRFERVSPQKDPAAQSGMEEFSRAVEAPGFQAIVISAETAARYPLLAGAEERTYQWGSVQLVVLSNDPVRWSPVIAGWLAEPTLNLTLYGTPGDASLSALRVMLAGAEESITVRGPYLPAGGEFSALFRMILANMAGIEESAVSEADLREAADQLGIGKYV
jgi:hypothetical protein